MNALKIVRWSILDVMGASEADKISSIRYVRQVSIDCSHHACCITYRSLLYSACDVLIGMAYE